MMLSGLGTHYKNAKDNAMMIARELEEQAMSVPGFALRKGLKGAGVDVLEGTSPQEVVGRVYGLLNSALDSKTYQDTYQDRSEERREGTGWRRTVRSRRSPYS